MVNALIFDFDGVILDTETPDFSTWQEVFRDHGTELDRSVWTSLIGRGHGAFDMYGHLEERAARTVDREPVGIERRRRYLELVASNPLLPGVLDYVLGAKRIGLKLGLASSASRNWVDGHLTARDLIHHFDCIKGSDDVANVKPDPELYLSALEQLDARAESSMAIEDSPVGVAAAKAAGLFCVAVPNPMTTGLPLEEADLVLDSLANVTLDALVEMAVRARA